MLKFVSTLPVLALLLFVAPDATLAKDLKGRVALGGQLEPLGVFDEGQVIIPGGLSLKAWFGDIGVQGILGFVMVSSDHDSSAVAAGAVRLLVNAARAEDTNLFVGGGVRLLASESRDDPFGLDLLVGVEHFFGEHFSVAGQVGLSVSIFEDFELIQFGQAASWGTSFHYYF